jgi:hypothetical protein
MGHTNSLGLGVFPALEVWIGEIRNLRPTGLQEAGALEQE